MNIIIVGCGKVGEQITKQLMLEDDINITVIDKDYDVVQTVNSQYDVMAVVGNGVNIETLTEAGVKNTDILIAVTDSDELNLLICLVARKAGNCRTIARVRNPEYHREAQLLKEDLGLAMIINPEEAAAGEIARVLRFPSAIQINTFAKGRVEILKFKIPQDSVLDQRKIMDISAHLGCDVLVCGVERNEEAFIPRGDFVLRSGDFIHIVASPKNTTAFFKKIGVNTNRVKDAMIVGGGTISYYLAEKLLQTGIEVKLFEQDAARCEKLCLLLPKADIIHADGSDNHTLLEEGLENAEAFVALTNIDEENILLCLFAKSKSKGKIVTKINRIAFDEVINNLDLDTTIYPKRITAEYIVRYVRAKKNSIGSNIETMHFILDGKAEALEFNIRENSPVLNRPIEELPIRKDVLIACINHKGTIFTPRGYDVIQPHDTVIVVTTRTGLKDISDILERSKL